MLMYDISVKLFMNVFTYSSVTELRHLAQDKTLCSRYVLTIKYSINNK